MIFGKINKNTTIFLLFLTIFSTNSCTYIYGIKEIEKVSVKDYELEKKELSLVNKNVHLNFITSKKEQFQEYCSSPNKAEEKNLSQPIQILYFNNNIINSFHINCLAEGTFFNLNWNTNNRFETFPPKTALAFPTHKTSSIYSIYPSLKTNQNKIVIFWTSMLYRQSKEALLTITNNLKKFELENEYEIYLINTNNFYLNSNKFD